MSINKLISIKNPIVDAMDMLGVDHTAFTPLFTRWAILAEKDIGSYFQFKKKRAVLDIVNCHACLPADAVYLQRALLGDFGCDCADLFNSVCGNLGAISADQSSLSQGGFLIVDLASSNGTIRSFVGHTVQGNKIIFNQDYDGQKTTIQYLGYETDCDGFMMVGENHVQAIMWNLIWKFYFQKKDINNFEISKMREAKLEWNRECSHSRAVDGELTETEREYAVDMLHDPYIGRGLYAGMTTTLDNWAY